MTDFEKEGLGSVLRRNINLFVHASSDIPRIDTRALFHRLTNDSIMKSISHRKHKVDEDKMKAIDEEVQKLRNVGFITKVRYPSWLDNVVIVGKSSNK